jgi:hypothetical protein
MLTSRLLLLVLLAAAGCTSPDVRPTNPTPQLQSSEAGPAIPDLATLTRQASLVIVGQLSAPGSISQTPQPVQTPIGPTRPVPGQPNSGAISVPVTTYAVEVERVARGNATPGTQVSVVQSGNPIRNALPSQDDTPMAMGERYVLFLQRADSGSGSFLQVGGIQGRLAIDAQGRVHPVGSGSPATRAHDGQPVDDFLNDVAAIS